MLPQVNFEQRTLEGPGVDIAVLIRKVYAWIVGGDFDAFSEMLRRIWDIYSIIAIFLALLFFAGFIYAKIRYGELSDIEQAALRNEERRWAERYGGSSTKNSRWTEIERHVASDNPQYWKVAIIEADILLEETLTNAGYVGATIGEKLKSANTTSFTTLQDAWEAHKVRNQIAHQGGDFILTKRIALETVTRFERVFREFGVI